MSQPLSIESRTAIVDGILEDKKGKLQGAIIIGDIGSVISISIACANDSFIEEAIQLLLKTQARIAADNAIEGNTTIN